MSNFDSSNVTNLVGLWDFRSGAETRDTGLDDGIAQNGSFEGGASASGDQAKFDGSNDRFDVDGSMGSSSAATADAPFDMDRGTIEVQFTQDNHVGSSPDTIVSRGESDDANSEGYFSISVTDDGAVEVIHTNNGEYVKLSTEDGIVASGEEINVKYSWDEDTGLTLEVENLESGETDTVTSNVTGLTMEIGDNDDENFTFGAREEDDGSYDRFFDGSIDYVAIYEESSAEDGAVDGESTGEVMELGYDDADGPNDQGGDLITDDADLIYGNGGDDTIDGAGGNDTIYGDNAPGSTTSTSEIFRWSDASGFGNGVNTNGFTQDTGNAEISFGVVYDTSNVVTAFQTSSQNVDDLDASVGDRSSLQSVAGGRDQQVEYKWTSNDGLLENVEFRVNDIDGDGLIRVMAYDAEGNEIEVVLSDAGSGLQLYDADGNGTNEVAYSTDNDYTDATAAEHSVLVTIPGPVASFTLYHAQFGSDNSGINITDITYDVPAVTTGEDGDDVISGADGSDVIYGQGGDDTITGGDDADQLFGGDDADTFLGGTDGDAVDGGDGGDDNDTLDLRGLGPIEIVDETTDADGNSTSGTVNFLDTGESLKFTEIETILSDPAGPTPDGDVDGEETAEDMAPGYDDADGATDGGGDLIDGADGLDDIIYGNGGDDTIDSGDGNDRVEGGDGDDTILITETGSGIDDDVIVGGEGDETSGDTIDTSDVSDDLFVDIYAPETGTINDEDSGAVTNFFEIENIVLGEGDDTVHGSDGADNVDAGGGADTMLGGGGNDTLAGGAGDDTIHGGAGDDSLLGGAGNDSIIGGDGSDVVEDLEGDNIIDTSGGSPLPDLGFPSYGPFPEVPADGDPNDDRDFVTTGSGNDSITTGDDADTIVSGAGNDTIDSGIDDDYVDAGSGHDLITTGEGNDTVLGGDGNDTIYGGLGPSFPSSTDIPDAPGTGTFGPDPETGNGRDLLQGGRGHDVIYGEDDDDTLIGGSGADTLDGGIDDDLLQGGIGQDDLIGGQGADTMEGGDDRDFFIINDREDAFGDVIDGGTGGNDVDTLDLTGLGRFEIVGETVDADGDSTSGTVNFLNASGGVEGSLSFTEIERLVICFTPGTAIATPRGEVDVQNLRVGDRVITRDNGVQAISWIGRKKLGAADLIADPKLRPVLIKQGSLGNNLPERDMMVSPNHRMLMANSQTQVLFDEREVLVASKFLVGQPGIHQLDTLGTEYIHVMFENHEVILGDGTWTESFQPGDHSLSGIDDEQREEIFKLFPSLQSDKGRRAYSSARQSLKAHEAKMLRETMANY